ncbi:MAG: glycosyltransferase [Pirellulales bacterium]
MHAILISIGSLGDTLPFLTVGKTLAARGHRVTMVANAHYRQIIERAGVGFIENLTEQDYNDFLMGQSDWSGLRALKEMGELVKQQVEKIYNIVRDEYVPGETVVAAQGYAFGARVAQEQLGVPLATVHLQPMWFRSIYDPPGLPNWIPRWVPKGLDRFIDWIIDMGVGPVTNEFRESLGLPSVGRLMKGWWNSPQLVLGLFPDWFNPPQPDWPSQTVLTGFPVDYAEPAPPSPELAEYLAAGEPPIVFIQSSVMREAEEFFAASIEAVRRLGRRAVLLTPHPEQLPPRLPAGVKHFDFVPLEQLLPHSAVFVHHGGIGTIGHSLAAGVPQLVVPMIYDQPDNAQRLERLEVSTHLWPRKYKARRVADKLQYLLETPSVTTRSREFAARIAKTRPLEEAANQLEALQGTDAAAKVACLA